MGEQGREVYKMLNWAKGETEYPVKVLVKFESYISKQKKQGASESFDHFVKHLKLLLMDCEYTMLIDAIISGVHEKRLQERLLDRGEDLTLAKALEIPQQYEMSQKQMRIVSDDAA